MRERERKEEEEEEEKRNMIEPVLLSLAVKSVQCVPFGIMMTNA
jgi:hypothetical protein